MQSILPSSGNIMKILGKAKPAENELRWMTYVLARPVEDGILLFHVLTREMLLLTRDEYEAPDNVPELREKWFLVPQEMNDRKYADHVRFIRKTVHKKPEHITSYTIFTTTDCNARCFYCYEMGRSRIPMSVETAHKVAAYIAKHCGDKKKVSLGWFGGEPLFNKGVIDIICNDLVASGIEYRSGMVSNGYLFDDDTVRQAVELWKLTWVQITLDGTEEVYNQSKAYIYKNSKSPYQIVLDNIGKLLESGIRVHVRMNMDRHNAEDLFVLADILHERFAGKDKLSVYSHVLFESEGGLDNIRTDEERHKLYMKQQRLWDRLVEYDLTAKRYLGKELSVNHCMADSGKSLTVLPNGELGLCEHFSEDNFVGHIDMDGLDEVVVKQFQEQWEATEACEDCTFYPECIRLKKCIESKECYPEMRDEKRQKMLESMCLTYTAWLSKEETDEEEQFGIC